MTLDEFLDGVDRSHGPMACWPWTGAVSSTGYGSAWVDGRSRNAHQLAYELVHGQVPRGHVVRHLCVDRSSRRLPGGALRERLCCNPAHLRAGTPSENAADRTRHGRSGGGRR